MGEEADDVAALVVDILVALAPDPWAPPPLLDATPWEAEASLPLRTPPHPVSSTEIRIAATAFALVIANDAPLPYDVRAA